MRLCFLDLDGVANSTAFFRASKEAAGQNPWGQLPFGASQLDPRAMGFLNQLVEATDCQIVMSTSWRHVWPFDEIAQMMGERGFKHTDRIIGETPTEGLEGYRGDEIREWFALERERKEIDPDYEPVTSFVILDDNDEFDGDLRTHFIQTSPQVGLTEKDIQKAIAILNQQGA